MFLKSTITSVATHVKSVKKKKICSYYDTQFLGTYILDCWWFTIHIVPKVLLYEESSSRTSLIKDLI